jgi:lipoate-protein ligase A
VIRRNTGGGTVFQDLGNVCFSVIVDNARENLDYKSALQPIINFLNQQKINAQFSGRNDLVVDEFKISGNAQLKTKDRTLIHGTLLFDVDLTKFGQYLTVNEEKIKHQKIKSKSSRVKNLRQFYQETGRDLDVETFFQELIDYYLRLDETEEIRFSDEQIRAIQEIKMNKYDR